MRRILDELPDSSEAAFLRRASRKHVPARSRARAATSVAMAAATLSSAATTTAAVNTGAFSSTLIKWIACGALVFGGIGVGGWLLSRGAWVASTTPVEPASASTPANAASAPLSGVTSMPSKMSATSVGALPEAPPSRSTKAAPRVAIRPSPVSTVSAKENEAREASTSFPPSPEPPKQRGSGLADEIAAIESAKKALGEGGRSGSDECFALLDRYDANHPHGKLRQEADALRIRALITAGRSKEARARLDGFRRTYPGSPHVSTIAALLGGP